MKFTTLYLGILPLFFMFSCNQETTPDQIDQLSADMWYIHDEVMPQFGVILNMVDYFERKLEDGSLDDQASIEARALIDELEFANEGMRKWMNEILLPEEIDELEEKEAISYLQYEKSQISDVRDRMLQSVEKANVFYENLHK